MDSTEIPRLLLRPVEAAEALALGRSKVYELIAAGVLPSVRVGGSLRIPVHALREWVTNAEKCGGGGEK